MTQADPVALRDRPRVKDLADLRLRDGMRGAKNTMATVLFGTAVIVLIVPLALV